jgi:hypothetical protein
MNAEIQKLKLLQAEDGSFQDSSGKASVLHTSIILSLLCKSSEKEELKEIKTKAVEFLLFRKNKNWEFGESLLSDFSALSTLAECDKSIINGSALAIITKRLTEIEEKEGGPYHSPDGKIDPATNAAIARFLSLFEVELPSLKIFNEQSGETFGISETEASKTAKSLSKKEIMESENTGMFTAEESKIMEIIYKKFDERMATFPPELRSVARSVIDKTISGNRDKQMSLMSFYTKQAFGKRGEQISDEIVAEMGLANIFFWTAFIIYDDFWDEDEAAQPKLLPVANIFARHYINYFITLLPKDSGFSDFFHQIMDNLDAANFWETQVCRTKVEGSAFYIPKTLPNYADYENKFRPASGHVLGPVAMLMLLGYKIDSSEIKNFIDYFRHYLIAMQINDDAHDWEEDMGRGHISTVVDMLSLDFGKKEGIIDLEKDLPGLKKVFWFKTIKKAAETAISHTEKSRRALKNIGVFEDTAPLERIINASESVAKKALAEQAESIKFLETYK